MLIKAAVTYETGTPFEIKDVTLSEPKESEVLVKMAGCGICHNDLFIKDNGGVPLPVVLGHEGSGVVVKTGHAVKKVKPGDHIVFCSYACYECEQCLKGHPAACEKSYPVNFGGAYADGTKRLKDAEGRELSCFFSQSSFATYAIGDEKNAVKVDAGVPLEMLGPLGCGIQTGAGSVINRLKPSPGDSIAVFGCGSVGLSAIMAARLSGCSKIIGIDTLPERLELALELGATHVINGEKTPDLVKEVISITGKGADFSFDTTAVPELINAALFCLKRRGVCGVVGSAGNDTMISIKYQPALMSASRTLTGIVQGDSRPDLFIPQLIEFYKSGLFPFDRLITYYDFKDINKAAEDSHSGKAVKPVLKY